MRIAKNLIWGLLILLAVVVAAWLRGVFTPAIVERLQKELPYAAGSEIRIHHISHAQEAPSEAGRIVLTISADRVGKALHEATHWACLLPGGLVRDGLVIEGAWTPRKRDDTTREKVSMGVEIPFAIAVGDTENDHPRLAGRLATPLLTRYVLAEFEEDFVEDREEWELGHYAYAIEPAIQSGSIRTTNSTALSTAAFSDPLYLALRGRADVRMTLEENIGTVKVRGGLLVEAEARLRFIEEHDGLSPRYRADLRTVEANVRGVNNEIDAELSDRLRKKWHRALNKEKRRERLARKRLPQWFPTDVMIDIRFTPDIGN